MKAVARYLAGYLLSFFRERVGTEDFRHHQISRVLLAPGLDQRAVEAIRRMFPSADLQFLKAGTRLAQVRRSRPDVAVVPMSGGPWGPRLVCLLSGARHKLLVPDGDYIYRLGLRVGLWTWLWAILDRLLLAPLVGLCFAAAAPATHWRLARKTFTVEQVFSPNTVIVIRLVPAGVFAGLLRRLRRQWPRARLVGILGSAEGEEELGDLADVIVAPRHTLRQLLALVRGVRADTVVLAGGADYGLSLTYWKAVVLAALAGAGSRYQWEVGERLPGRPLAHMLLLALARGLVRWLDRTRRPAVEPMLRPWLRRQYYRRPRRGPRLVQIGLTEACNYHCLMCPFHNPAVDGEHRESELPRLSYEVYASLLADLKRMGTRSVDICGNGEPLTHPEAMDMIALAREMGFDVSLASNGFLLTDVRLQKLVDLGIRRLHVSLNAGTAETYAKMHPGTPPGTFETILRRLAAAAEYADATAQRRIEIEYSVVLTRLNMGELTDMVKAAHRARAGWLVVLLMGPVPGQPDLAPQPEDWPQIRADMARARQLASELGIEANFQELDTTASAEGTRPVYERIPCYIGHEFALVVAGGSVIFCCHCSFPLGNLNSQRFPAIWNSDLYQEWRARAMALPRTKAPLPDCGCFYACSHVGANLGIHERLHGRKAVRWAK